MVLSAAHAVLQSIKPEHDILPFFDVRLYLRYVSWSSDADNTATTNNSNIKITAYITTVRSCLLITNIRSLCETKVLLSMLRRVKSLETFPTLATAFSITFSTIRVLCKGTLDGATTVADARDPIGVMSTDRVYGWGRASRCPLKGLSGTVMLAVWLMLILKGCVAVGSDFCAILYLHTHVIYSAHAHAYSGYWNETIYKPKVYCIYYPTVSTCAQSICILPLYHCYSYSTQSPRSC